MSKIYTKGMRLGASTLILPFLLGGCLGSSGSPAPSNPGSTCSLTFANGARNLSDEGVLPSDQELAITVALSLSNENDLKQQLHDLYDPTNPSYHHFMAPGEFRARYAPSADQVAQVQSFLASHGLHDFVLNDNGYLLDAKGTSAAVSSAFKTELHQYRASNEARYFAPSIAPELPSSLPIQGVVGLENLPHYHTHFHAKDAAAAGNSLDGTGPYNGLAPSDIQKAYNVPTTVTGSGQTMALVELDGYTQSDVTAYENEFGLTNVPMTNVLVDSASGADDCTGGGVEVTLDIELMAAIAPGASSIRVYEGPNSTHGLLAVYAKIASDDNAAEISTSWGLSENETATSTLTSENTIFAQMATQGQSFFAAAGDNGAYDGSPNYNGLVVDDPSSQPYVVGVGGTSLSLHYNGSYSSETSWNDGFPNGEAEGGGGGISSYWSIPSYQSGNVSVASEGSTTMRNVPDVSLEADPDAGYAIYYGGSWTIVGGTSCAAPLWAGFTALVNQERVANSKSVLGFPNTAIYSVGSGASYTTNFHDIADSSTNLYYPAVTGYDLSTGWGSFKGTALFNSLAAY